MAAHRDWTTLPGIWHARRAARGFAHAARRRSPRGIVLLYHRVAGPRRDPQWLDVPATTFEAHVAWIAANTAPLALAEFEAHRRRGSLPARALAVTLDDGYADNLPVAAPILARHKVPATVFVTAGMVGSTREFWWDEAERVAFSDRPLEPPVPSITIAWSASDGAPLAGGAPLDMWTIAHDTDPSPRHRLYRAICEAVRARPAADRDAIMGELRRWAGVAAEARASHRALTRDELRALAAIPGITIGAHTMTHPVLAALPAPAQRDELEDSREELGRELGRDVICAAYPYGTRADVSAATTRAARDSGVAFAMANEPGAAWRWSSRWRLPRHLVRAWPADELAARAAAWLEA